LLKGNKMKIQNKKTFDKKLKQFISDNPNTEFTYCHKCGHLLESDICDDCGYDNWKERD